MTTGAAVHQVKSILVGIASYGTKQDHHLRRVIAEYKKLAIPCRIVVLTDREKPIQGAEVVAGLPSRDPYSLPFAHRALFEREQDNFDLFIYSEDDTLITGSHIEAVLAGQAFLEQHEILGFVRSETSPEGQQYVTSIHRHFRWLPESVESRSGEVFAQLSNEHSGCFIVNRRQLRAAIASGGFVVAPHDERYGMLESAASDIYTQCGLRRLMWVSRIGDFTVPHLANKYYSHTGIRAEEFAAQARAVTELHRTRSWRGTLFQAQSRAPGFRWSKDLYERPDAAVVEALPASARRVLSIGTGWGRTEESLVRSGVEVCTIPVDAVFGNALAERGIRTVHGPLETAISDLKGEHFDAVLLIDVLHLVADPVLWLQRVSRVLAPTGCIVARVNNTTDPLSWWRDLLDGRRRPFRPTYETVGAQPVSVGRLRTWCRASGLELRRVIPIVNANRRERLGKLMSRPLESVFADKLIIQAHPSSRVA